MIRKVDRQGVAYGYARVSTAAQVEDGYSLGCQQKAIEEYRAANGALDGLLWGGVFIDNEKKKGKQDGVSGKTRLCNRPAGGELIGRLKPGDHVICNDLSRMFRSFRDAVAVVEDWIDRGIVLHEVRNRLDTSTTHGRMFFRFMALFAQMEREMASERTREVLARRKRDGKAVGGRAKPGMKYVGGKGNRRQVVDQTEQAAIDQIMRLVDDGMMFDEIYLALIKAQIRTRGGEVWSRSRIYRAYLGRKNGTAASCKDSPTEEPSE